MVEFKRNKFSGILDLLLPLVVIAILITLMNRSRIEVNQIRMEHLHDFSAIVTIALSTSQTREGLNYRIDQMSEYINSMVDKAVFIYDDGLNQVTSNNDHDSELNFDIKQDKELRTLVESEDRGQFAKEINGLRYDIHFEWIHIEVLDRSYLVMYTINQKIMDFTFLYVLTYISIFGVLAYAIKTNFVDRIIYAKILQGNQKRLIDDFGYRKHDE